MKPKHDLNVTSEFPSVDVFFEQRHLPPADLWGKSGMMPF